MEKFAVDLDKVLDEFEFNEDRAEQMVAGNRKSCSSSSSEMDGVSCQLGINQHLQTFEGHHLPEPPLNCFSKDHVNGSNTSVMPTRLDGSSCGNSGSLKNGLEHPHSDLYWPQDIVIENVNIERSSSSNKLNVSGVFSSLNEYLNAGNMNVEVKIDDSDRTDNKMAFGFEEIGKKSSNSKNKKIHLQNVIPSGSVEHDQNCFEQQSDVQTDIETKSQMDSICYHEVEVQDAPESDLKEGSDMSPLINMDESHRIDESCIDSKSGHSLVKECDTQQLISNIGNLKLNRNSSDVISNGNTLAKTTKTTSQNETENYISSSEFSCNDVCAADVLFRQNAVSQPKQNIVNNSGLEYDMEYDNVADTIKNVSGDIGNALHNTFSATAGIGKVNHLGQTASSDSEDTQKTVPDKDKNVCGLVFKTSANQIVSGNTSDTSDTSGSSSKIEVSEPVKFNAMDDFTKEELQSYLEELEKLGDNMIVASASNADEKLTSTSKHADVCKGGTSAELTNFLKIEGASMGSVQENTCLQEKDIHCENQSVMSKGIRKEQGNSVTNASNTDNEIKSNMLAETESSVCKSIISNSVKVEDNMECHTDVNDNSNSHDGIIDFTSNMKLCIEEVLIPEEKEVSDINTTLLTTEPSSDNISSKVTETCTNGNSQTGATISINMLSTGKSTANVNNVISIECQQTKNSTEVYMREDLNESLESVHLRKVADTTCDKDQTVIDTIVDNQLSSNDNTVSHVSNSVPSEKVTSSNITENSSNVENDDVNSVIESLVQAPKDGGRINVLGEEERPSRPKFLFLPSKITMESQAESADNTNASSQKTVLGLPGETPIAHHEPSEDISADTSVSTTQENSENPVLTSPDVSDNSSIEVAVSPIPSIQASSPSNNESLTYILSPEERSHGKLPPFWVPDGDAPNCMLCDLKFTVLKRRHHCRACGKVFCSKCCNLKSRLEYMDNGEARVCQPCFDILARVAVTEQGESASESPSSISFKGGGTPLGRQPNPNNPMEYCSTIPPLEQAASTSPQPVPSVLVPVGVLKREGSTRSKSDVAKQVMFSDGIRPGGDLTELDGSSEPRLPYRRQERVLKRVGTPPGIPSNTSHHSALRSWLSLEPKTKSYIPSKGLPPLATLSKGEVRLEEVSNMEKLLTSLRLESNPATLFALNRNLFVKVKILNLDCCVNRLCWCFSTMGMSSVGQDEIVIILECLQDEATIPRDIFCHLNTIYQEASRGSMVSEMGHSIFQGTSFLGSAEHGGFIYIRPSFQCLHKLILPSAPYLVGILFHRWEIPWAKVFPIRLMLRLGAEFRYYPCMLVSIRLRKAVYCEIGHTIINLLADFRNLSYTLPSVRGLVIHMEDRHTSILLPKNRYDQVARALNNSNDHVLALAANFSLSADSHLVCIQSNGDESYHTQAINIHNKPRKVTGASFVVFNGALKMSSNLTAKSSIVEDGLMVQITPDTIQELRTALRKMQDFSVRCGPAGAVLPDELVNIKWVQDDRNFNIGVVSFIDGLALNGVPSIRVHNGTDYMGATRFIRWTEVFILQSGENSERSGDPLDISRLSESLARATCLALVNYLDLLAQAGLIKIAVRANIHPENVGYEAGSRGQKLPPIYMKSLDNELVPVLHKAASMAPESPPVLLELIFHVMLQ